MNLQRLHLFTSDELKTAIKAADKVRGRKFVFPNLEAVETAARKHLVIWYRFLRLPRCREEWRVVQRIVGRLFETYPA